MPHNICISLCSSRVSLMYACRINSENLNNNGIFHIHISDAEIYCYRYFKISGNNKFPVIYVQCSWFGSVRCYGCLNVFLLCCLSFFLSFFLSFHIFLVCLLLFFLFILSLFLALALFHSLLFRCLSDSRIHLLVRLFQYVYMYSAQYPSIVCNTRRENALVFS